MSKADLYQGFVPMKLGLSFAQLVVGISRTIFLWKVSKELVRPFPKF